ncbi:hypothetical protein H0H81_009575 [Sphagnurus paluster]|uniref:WD repeat domain phosphoinositide-interacting protein 2 n=1 Tax=Sphagnurus paluster TaxID=117069 RepID=A0A9P7FVC6_9AGAR|nr:hypothetical protein H0H81_009575 [Sphagnurus paluster]
MNDGARGIVEMLFCTSLIALVGAADQPQSSPRKLQIVNTKRQSMICELLFPSSILAVKLNRKTLVIVLETEIYIYDISNMRLQHVIETSANPEAICALSPSADSSYLAYPSPVPSHNSQLAGQSTSTGSASATQQQTGDVLLFSTRSLSTLNVIQAHKTPISFLSINSTGTLLATASEKGTVIRVWSVPGVEKLYQFRRGTREARIYSISFNLVSSLLAVSSAHDTVHIFKLGPQKSSSKASSESPSSPPESIDSREGVQGLDGGYDAFIEKKKKSNSVSSSLRRKSMQMTKSLTHSVGGYLPNTLTEMWEPSRDFAFLRLPTSGTRCIVALSGSPRSDEQESTLNYAQRQQIATEIYHDIWQAFYRWEYEECKAAIRDCERPVGFASVSVPDSREDSPLDFDFDAQAVDEMQEYFTVEEFAQVVDDLDETTLWPESSVSQGMNSVKCIRYSTMSCFFEKREAARPYPRYECCTPSSYSYDLQDHHDGNEEDGDLDVDRDIAGTVATFAPYADDKNFRLVEYLSEFNKFIWQEDFVSPDPDCVWFFFAFDSLG